MIKTEYKYIGQELKLTSKTNDNNTIIINTDDIIKFSPEVGSLNSTVYEVVINNSHKKAFYAPESLVNKIVENSIKKEYDINEVYEIEVPKVLTDPILKSVVSYQKEMFEILKNSNLSANGLEVITAIGDMISAMRKLTNEGDELVNINELTETQTLAFNKFKQPVTLNLEKKNVTIDESPYKYLKTIEDLALDTFCKAIEWAEKEEDIYMSRSNLNDVLDIIMVAKYINKGELVQAHGKISRLDTYVREGFDDSFWEDFMVGRNRNSLMQEEKKYADLVTKTHKPNIIKIK